MYFRLLFFYIFIIMACNTNESPDTASVASKNTAVPLRSEIEDIYKWDMSAVYATEEAWEEDLNLVKELYPDLANFKGKLLSSPEVLIEAIELRNKVNQTLWKLYHYASNSSNADVRNEKYQEMVQRVINTSVKIGETTAYFTPEIIESDYSVLEDFMVQNEYLRNYEKQLKDLIIAEEHFLSDKVERLHR